MAYTATFETGLETGTLDTIFTSHTGGTIQSTIKHAGNNALYYNDEQDAQANLASQNVVVGRFYYYFDTFPAANSLLIDMYQVTASNPRIWFTPADSKLMFEIDVSTTKSIALSTDTWYRVDFKFTCTGSPHTFDAIVAVGENAGNAISQVTQAAAADTITYIKFEQVGSVANLYYDDLVVSQTPGDYPIGPTGGGGFDANNYVRLRWTK
jgi:hypothetical protein